MILVANYDNCGIFLSFQPLSSMKTRHTHRPVRGFSLIELLFVMAVISTLAAVAIFNLSSSVASTKVAKSQSNAQSICHLYQSARSVGAKFRSTTKEGILEELIAGKKGAGPFVASVFQLELEGEEKEEALAYCVFDRQAKMLIFQPGSGGS